MQKRYSLINKTPDPEEFLKLVTMYEEKYESLEMIYRDSLKKFNAKELHNFNKDEIQSILAQYLMKWGNMTRVLGYKGCTALGTKLQQMDTRLKTIKQEDLLTIDLSKTSKEIADFYTEIMNTTWTSKKGRVKRVGPTSASKALHLVAPNVFMIWDRAIRQYYGFQENGKDYVRFLTTMQSWLKELKPNMEKLQKYSKSYTKIIDEYNWIKCRI